MTIGQTGYEVGHGKPPREHQWRPGQSGNPAGRSRKKRKPAPVDFEDALMHALLDDHSVAIKGTKKKMPAYEIIAQNVVRHLLNAQGKEQILMIRSLAAMGIFGQLKHTRETMHEDEPPVFSQEDLELIRIMERAVRRSEECELTSGKLGETS